MMSISLLYERSVYILAQLSATSAGLTPSFSVHAPLPSVVLLDTRSSVQGPSPCPRRECVTPPRPPLIVTFSQPKSPDRLTYPQLLMPFVTATTRAAVDGPGQRATTTQFESWWRSTAHETGR